MQYTVGHPYQFMYRGMPVTISYCGEWSPTATYNPADCVTYKDVQYICVSPAAPTKAGLTPADSRNWNSLSAMIGETPIHTAGYIQTTNFHSTTRIGGRICHMCGSTSAAELDDKLFLPIWHHAFSSKTSPENPTGLIKEKDGGTPTTEIRLCHKCRRTIADFVLHFTHPTFKNELIDDLVKQVKERILEDRKDMRRDTFIRDLMEILEPIGVALFDTRGDFREVKDILNDLYHSHPAQQEKKLAQRMAEAARAPYNAKVVKEAKEFLGLDENVLFIDRARLIELLTAEHRLNAIEDCLTAPVTVNENPPLDA